MGAIQNAQTHSTSKPLSQPDPETVAQLAARPEELVVDVKTGQVRQAGATQPEGQGILEFKLAAERSLYVFARVVLGFNFLHPPLHSWLAAQIQTAPPYRKGFLLPRYHGKTVFISQALPLHLLIQPAPTNCYAKERPGTDTRILMASETAGMAEGRLGWIIRQLEGNQLIRGFWPHTVWERPKTQAMKWSPKQIILPRQTDFPDPTIRTIGADTAITGGRCDVVIKDDLATEKAAESPALMTGIKEWNKLSRALLHSEESLEFYAGTVWGVDDLYADMMANDPTVTWSVRSLVEPAEVATDPDQPIWPAKVASMGGVEKIKKDYAHWFPLIFMNTVTDVAQVDFPATLFRHFWWQGEREARAISFRPDQRDERVREGLERAPDPPPFPAPGTPVEEAWPQLFGEEQALAYFRLEEPNR